MDRLGRDTVHREGRRLIVQSPVPMPEWKASTFRRTEVVYRDEHYFVADVSKSTDGRHRYVLEPWPHGLCDRPSRTIRYEEEYIRLRDGNRARAWAALLLWPLLLCANPVIGCLWAATKRGLQRRVGLDPRLATLQALFCQGLRWQAILGAAMVLLLDAIMRYSHLQTHPEDFLGVGEWLTRFER